VRGLTAAVALGVAVLDAPALGDATMLGLPSAVGAELGVTPTCAAGCADAHAVKMTKPIAARIAFMPATTVPRGFSFSQR
jgi:hypothetical protein